MVKILIVDDSSELVEFLTHLLNMKGYVVVSATSKNTLLNKIFNFTPDLILLDVRLNGTDGRDLCREIKQNELTNAIPVILLSASPELLENYEDCYAADVIEKPFNISSVIQKIEKVLDLTHSS